MRKTSTLLVVCVLLLVALGIVMVASASSVLAMIRFHNPHRYFYQQAIWAFIGLIGAYICYKRDYHLFQKYAIFIGITTIVLLVAVLIPGIGSKVNGSRRWLRMGPLSLQPSELAKLGTLICLAAWMSYVEPVARSFKKGFIIPLAALGFTVLLVLAEPDFGTTLLLALTGMAIMFVGGSHIGYLTSSAFLGGSLFIAAVLHDDVRRERMLAFWDPAAHPAAAFHLIQSKTAFIRGHLTGVGLGNSLQKHQYLPEAHTDFILPIIGEELGFVCALAVLILFSIIMVCGMRIAMRATDRFGKLLAFGITMIMTTQAAVNIAVVTGAMPTKGLPLPFISYGGSSMLVSITFIGILLSIARQIPEDDLHGAHSARNKARRL